MGWLWRAVGGARSDVRQAPLVAAPLSARLDQAALCCAALYITPPSGDPPAAVGCPFCLPAQVNRAGTGLRCMGGLNSGGAAGEEPDIISDRSPFGAYFVPPSPRAMREYWAAKTAYCLPVSRDCHSQPPAAVCGPAPPAACFYIPGCSPRCEPRRSPAPACSAKLPGAHAQRAPLPAVPRGPPLAAPHLCPACRLPARRRPPTWPTAGELCPRLPRSPCRPIAASANRSPRRRLRIWRRIPK